MKISRREAIKRGVFHLYLFAVTINEGFSFLPSPLKVLESFAPKEIKLDLDDKNLDLLYDAGMAIKGYGRPTVRTRNIKNYALENGIASAKQFNLLLKPYGLLIENNILTLVDSGRDNRDDRVSSLGQKYEVHYDRLDELLEIIKQKRIT